MIKNVFRFADVLQKSGQTVTFIGKRADITANSSNQQWHSSDKEVKMKLCLALGIVLTNNTVL